MTDATRAIVRRPSPRLAEGEVTHIDRVALDVDLAIQQHGLYVELLQRYGLKIVEAPPAPQHPDGLFVEDALVMIGGHAVITRPGAASRRGEIDSIIPVVDGLGLSSTAIEAPATVDGGDVLCLGSTVVVPADALAATAELRSWGFAVEQIDVSELQKIEAGVTCMSVLV
jgi:dimethylargininase